MYHSGWFGIGVALGAAVSASVAVWLMAFGMGDSALDALKKWETLAAGFLALVGAILTVAWIQKQIDHARKQEDERRERRNYATRAAMPSALTELVDYAEDALDALKMVPLPAGPEAIIVAPRDWTPPTLPKISNEALVILRTCVEFAEAGPRKEIAELLGHLQVASSRLRGLFKDELATPDGRTSAMDMHTHLADFIVLHLLSDRMFDYARRETDEIVYKATARDIATRAVFAGVENYPGFRETLPRRYP